MTLEELKRRGWTVTLPADDGLARLLRAGAHPDRSMSPTGHKLLRRLASTAERQPAEGARSLHIGAGLAGVAADELLALLARARTEADPAADALAEFLAQQFGVTEATA